MSLISPNFAVKSIFFPNYGQGPFPKIAGKALISNQIVGICTVFVQPESHQGPVVQQVEISHFSGFIYKKINRQGIPCGRNSSYSRIPIF